MEKIKQLTQEELNEEFIKYFGKEIYNQEEMLMKLWPTQLAIADYLGVEPIPVLVEEIEEDSRYYPNDNYIVISKSLMDDEVEVLKCLTHEYKHYQQYMCIIHNVAHPLLEEWKKDFKTNYANVTSYEEMLALTVEVDAFAFTKYILDEWFNIKVTHPYDVYDEILSRYINKYFK